jgi:hypothetical protein
VGGGGDDIRMESNPFFEIRSCACHQYTDNDGDGGGAGTGLSQSFL